MQLSQCQSKSSMILMEQTTIINKQNNINYLYNVSHKYDISKKRSEFDRKEKTDIPYLFQVQCDLTCRDQTSTNDTEQKHIPIISEKKKFKKKSISQHRYIQNQTVVMTNNDVKMTGRQNLDFVAVNLSNKQITDLNLNLIPKPMNVSNLDLSSNKLINIPSFIYLQIKNLKILKLQNNQIKVLPIEIFSALEIEILDVQNNLMSNIPIQILLWKQCLVYLNLSKNHIQAITQTIPQLQSLKSLIINGNDFDSLPNNFVKFENQLKEFSIDWFKYCKPPQKELWQHEDLNQIFQILKLNSVQDSDIYLHQFISIFSTDPTQSMSLIVMHQTILEEDISVLRFFLAKYQYLCDEEDNDKHTPLSLAIKEEKYFAAKILIKEKCNVLRGGGPYGSALALAVLKIQYYLVKDLIKVGAFVDQKDSSGNTPLHYCFLIFNKDPKELYHIASFLLQNNANPNIFNDGLWTPIHLAIRKGYTEALKFVIEHNQKCKSQKFNLTILGGSNKLSPLYIASFNGYTKMVQLMLQHEPNSFIYLANNNIFINMSHKHTTISKLLNCAKQQFIQKNIIIKQKEQQSNFQKFRQVRTCFNQIASLKCEENETDPNNSDDLQQFNTQSNSHRSIKISPKKSFQRKRIIKRFPNENLQKTVSLNYPSIQKPSTNNTLTIETQENFNEDDIQEDYDWQIQVKYQPYIIAIGVEGLDNIQKQKVITQEKLKINRKFESQYNQINSIMINNSTKMKNNIINNEYPLSKRLGYINVFHHFLDLAHDFIGQMTGVSLYQIQVGGLFFFSHYEIQDQKIHTLLDNIWNMINSYKEIYESLQKYKDYDSINLQMAMTSKYPQTLSQYNNNSIITQYNITNDIYCIGKKQKDHFKYSETESGFQNSFIEENEILQNEPDIQTVFKNYIKHKPKFNNHFQN